MPIYTTTKCGKCGAIWENMSSTSARNESIGPPLIKCRLCLCLNRTNQVLYRDASLFKKIRFWLKTIYSIILLGIAPLAFGLYTLINPSSLNLHPAFSLLIIFIGLFFIYGFYKSYSNLDNIKNIEKKYDSNGGFLWSDEKEIF